MGYKTIFAKKVKITRTWLSLLIKKRKKPSPFLSKKIEKETDFKVRASVLRPDVFDK